ncbi:hypothetical protein [Prevotella sp. HUN102]|uniref:hypothetical protein n=1 Tax=Prevotella sp. HUN102 TaxID=1392486 RepID=UPI000A828A35|nr:hypothetical protein [Prevotella sp. HUN102]
MKKIPFCLLLMCLLSVCIAKATVYATIETEKAANALQDGGEDDRITPRELTKEMAKRYHLTKKQTRKVLKINRKYEDVACEPRLFGKRYAPQIEMQCRRELLRKYGKNLKANAGSAQDASSDGRISFKEEEEAELGRILAERKARLDEYEKKLAGILTEEQFGSYRKDLTGNGRRY